MPRILGRHEMFPRVSNKPWLNYGGGGSGSSWSSANASGSSSTNNSASSSTSLVRQRVSSTNLYSLDQHRHEDSSRRNEGLSYRIRDDDRHHHTHPENSTPASINTSADDWGYYVDFHSPQEERKSSFLPNYNDEEILSLEPSPVEWAVRGGL